MTSRYEIAKYWSTIDFISDMGEPSCFACGYYSASWDKPHSVRARWEKAKLERAHIIARSIGGPDEPSNYLLLCPRCHIDAPMTNDPVWMIRWAKNRESWVSWQLRRIIEEYQRLGGNLSELMGLDEKECRALYEEFQIANHPESDYFAPSNIAVMLMVAKERHGTLKNTLVTMGGLEREAIGERTRDAMRHKKAKGERVGTIQFGYHLSSNGINIEPDELEQAILGRIRELREEGRSVRAIAAQLNNEGFRTRRGTEWQHQYVYSLINREEE